MPHQDECAFCGAPDCTCTSEGYEPPPLTPYMRDQGDYIALEDGYKDGRKRVAKGERTTREMAAFLGIKVEPVKAKRPEQDKSLHPPWRRDK